MSSRASRPSIRQPNAKPNGRSPWRSQKRKTAINGLSLNLLLWSLVFSTDSIPLKFHLKWQRDEDHTMRRSSTLFCEHCECCGDDHYAPESRRDSRGVTQAAWRGEAPMQRPRQLGALLTVLPSLLAH